jgi:phosphatidylserine/phosphatidylglycerophosphate/cardiolipin synthase-like enzyme
VRFIRYVAAIAIVSAMWRYGPEMIGTAGHWAQSATSSRTHASTPAQTAQVPSAADRFLGIFSTAHARTVESTPIAAGGTVSVAFSPGNAEQVVVHTINGARKTILVAAYSFTSRPIATALLDAKARGVDVRVVADKSQRTERYTSIRFLANKGVPVRINSRYAIMHNKFLVIDGATVETGSFNFTRSATLRNAENVIVLGNMPEVAATYSREWNRLWDEADPL